MANNLMVFTGNANPALADAIARNIGVPWDVRALVNLAMEKFRVE